MDYFVRNNMKGKIFFPDSEGGQRPVSPLNTPLQVRQCKRPNHSDRKPHCTGENHNTPQNLSP